MSNVVDETAPEIHHDSVPLSAYSHSTFNTAVAYCLNDPVF